MNADRILVATDFSPCSEAALQWAGGLAEDGGAVLLIAHVYEPEFGYGGAELYFPAWPADDSALLAQLRAARPQADVPCEYFLLHGDTATALCDLARREGVSFIVMGTHGRTGWERLLLGSVAEALVRRAPCPVFTVKEGQVWQSAGRRRSAPPAPAAAT